MNWMQHLTQAFVTVVLLALGLAVYDRCVRMPQTPRLALVDVNGLYAAAQRQAAESALAMVGKGGRDGEKEGISAEVANAALGQIERTAADFGPKLSQALDALAQECQCTVVAAAAVHGKDGGIPDYTAAIAERLQLKAAL